MILHRAVAVLTGLSMLHLSVVSGDTACAWYPMGAAASTADADVAMNHDMHESADTAASMMQEHSCATPVQADCCRDMVSCSVIVGASVASGSALPPASRSQNRAWATRVLLTRAFPPEPPPPKA